MKAPYCRETSPYIYALVREDIPKSSQTVQLCHSTMQSAFNYGLKGEDRLVLLQAKNLFELELFASKLDILNIKYEKFFEPDHDMGFTSLATEPLIGGTKIFKSLPLWQP